MWPPNLKPPTPTSVNWWVTDGDGQTETDRSAIQQYCNPSMFCRSGRWICQTTLTALTVLHHVVSRRLAACKQSEHGSRIQTVGLEDKANKQPHTFICSIEQDATLCMGTISGFVANTANSRDGF